MRVKALAVATTLGLLGVPELANAVPALPSMAPLGISWQSDFLPVQWGPGPGPRGGPGPWNGPHGGPGPGPGGPGPWPGTPGGPGACPSPWGPVPCPP